MSPFPSYDRESLELLLEHLEHATSLKVVQAMLKQKKLHYSASSWEELGERRIIPAVHERFLNPIDLVGLLRDAEVCGHCHTFLFATSRSLAEGILDGATLRRTAGRLGYGDILSKPKILDLPDEPTVIDIWTGSILIGKVPWPLRRLQRPLPSGKFVAVKVAATRESRVFKGEREEGKRIHLTWEKKQVRANYVARLFETGLLEFRLASHRQGTDYQRGCRIMWDLLQGFFPVNSFVPLSLRGTMNRLITKQKALSDYVRFQTSTMQTDLGTTLTAATGGEQLRLFDDVAASSSIQAFLHHGGYCTWSNIWFYKLKSGIPTKDVHVLIPRYNKDSNPLQNELVVTAHHRQADYCYALDRLVRLS